MSYSVCRYGGAMCDGCMECYDRKPICDDGYEEIFLSDDDDIVENDIDIDEEESL